MDTFLSNIFCTKRGWPDIYASGPNWEISCYQGPQFSVCEAGKNCDHIIVIFMLINKKLWWKIW
jgi:hypothetical protein